MQIPILSMARTDQRTDLSSTRSRKSTKRSPRKPPRKRVDVVPRTVPKSTKCKSKKVMAKEIVYIDCDPSSSDGGNRSESELVVIRNPREHAKRRVIVVVGSDGSEGEG